MKLSAERIIMTIMKMDRS